MYKCSKEISLRELRIDDYQTILTWSKDDRFCEANGWEKRRDKAELYQWWVHCVNMKRADFIRMGIEYYDQLIGYADLAKIMNNSAEIGIVIGDSTLWGQGIGTQAMHVFIDFAFVKLEITTFHGETHESNSRSRKMMEKIGFTEVSRRGTEIYRRLTGCKTPTSRI